MADGFQLIAQSMAGLHVVRRQRRAMNTGLVCANAAQKIKIAQDAFGVYLNHFVPSSV